MKQKSKERTELRSPTNTTEAVIDDEKDFIDGIIYSLYEEAVDELDKQSEAEKADYNAVLDRFAELNGATKESPIVMMYAGFYLGVEKGLELAAKLEKLAK